MMPAAIDEFVADGPALRVRLAGVTASLSSTHPEFIDYAGEHLAPLRASGFDSPIIEATLDWHEHAPPADRHLTYPELRAMERVDRDIYRSATELAWFRIDELPSLHLRVKWDGERLRVHGDFFMYLSHAPYRDWLKRGLYWRQLPEMRRRRFTTLLYYLVYYPCFWWLERKRGLHPIHAGAIELDRRVLVFAGPSGVGKSTLTTGLAAHARARLISDTFLLHRGPEVLAVPEPLLLDHWSQSWLGAAGANLTPLSHRYCLNRGGFHWPESRRSNGGVADLVVFPQRSATHYLRPLSAMHARGRLSASDLIVNDLRRYWAFASVLELLDPTPLVHAREQQLAKFIEDVPAYELGICSEVTRAGIEDELFALLGALPTPRCA